MSAADNLAQPNSESVLSALTLIQSVLKMDEESINLIHDVNSIEELESGLVMLSLVFVTQLSQLTGRQPDDVMGLVRDHILVKLTEDSDS